MTHENKPRIYLTGASGRLGSYTLGYLLKSGYSVISTDISPLRDDLLASYPEAANNHLILDLCSIPDVERFFDTKGTSSSAQTGDSVDGASSALIHLAAIPDPLNKDWRTVHNNNVTSSYNVLYTAMIHGITRISQASSVNATGMSYTREGKQVVDELPLTEKETYRAEDAYALSKEICEIQARSLCRLNSSLRIASFRYFYCGPSYADAVPNCRFQDLWNWTSFEACAESCLLGITSEGWEGAEAFYICGDEIAWEGGVTPESKSLTPPADGSGARKAGTRELIANCALWRDTPVRPGWFGENPGEQGWRRATADTSKAKKLLGWVHRDGMGDDA